MPSAYIRMVTNRFHNGVVVREAVETSAQAGRASITVLSGAKVISVGDGSGMLIGIRIGVLRAYD